MNTNIKQDSETTKKPKAKSKIQVRDLTVKKDPKGGKAGDPCEGGQLHKH
jgi:hypothetical protein